MIGKEYSGLLFKGNSLFPFGIKISSDSGHVVVSEKSAYYRPRKTVKKRAQSERRCLAWLVGVPRDTLRRSRNRPTGSQFPPWYCAYSTVHELSFLIFLVTWQDGVRYQFMMLSAASRVLCALSGGTRLSYYVTNANHLSPNIFLLSVKGHFFFFCLSNWTLRRHLRLKYFPNTQSLIHLFWEWKNI